MTTPEDRLKSAWAAFQEVTPRPTTGGTIPPSEVINFAIEAGFTEAITVLEDDLNEAIMNAAVADSALAYGVDYPAIVRAVVRTLGLVIRE